MASLKRLKTLFTKNIGFTPQERVILLFLSAAFVIGIALNVFFGKRYSSNPLPLFDYTLLDQEFEVKSAAKPGSEVLEPATAAAPVPMGSVSLLSINTMTEEQFIAISGIGPVIAGRIIEFRRKNGPLNSVDDLLAVRGIGPARLRSIKQYLESKNKK